MTKTEKIQRYIDSVGIKFPTRYSVSIEDLFALLEEFGGPVAVGIAFQYGRAKGYRAAQAEVEK